MIRKPWIFWLAAFVVGWGADILFWQHSLGVNFLLWVVLILAGILASAFVERRKIAGWNIPLVLAAIACAAVLFIRREPLTLFLGAVLALGSLALLAAVFLNGKWIYFRMRDLITSGLRLFGSSLTGAVTLLQIKPVDPTGPATEKRNFMRISAAILRGLLFAIPILLVLALLLAAADPVFSDRLANILQFFDLARLPEYLFRLFYILVLVYLFAGYFLHSASLSDKDEAPQSENTGFRPFLGWVEMVVVLGSVVLLLGSFVLIQFTYFFGAQANISVEGYTYSEYAVRGFNELVTVALLSLGLYLGLAAITKTDQSGKKRLFSILSVVLLAEVVVILISSFQRLGLYEAAYGFTRLRTYTHFFIFWLGALLLTAAILEVIQKRHWFTQAVLVFCLGYGLTLAIVNVDGFIARANLARAVVDGKLDTAYLTSLSTDAIPVLVDAFNAPDFSAETHAELGGVLACVAYELNLHHDPSWQAYNWSEDRASRALASLGSALDAYPVYEEYYQPTVSINGESFSCWTSLFMD